MNIKMKQILGKAKSVMIAAAGVLCAFGAAATEIDIEQFLDNEDAYSFGASDDGWSYYGGVLTLEGKELVLTGDAYNRLPVEWGCNLNLYIQPDFGEVDSVITFSGLRLDSAQCSDGYYPLIRFRDGSSNHATVFRLSGDNRFRAASGSGLINSDSTEYRIIIEDAGGGDGRLYLDDDTPLVDPDYNTPEIEIRSGWYNFDPTPYLPDGYRAAVTDGGWKVVPYYGVLVNGTDIGEGAGSGWSFNSETLELTINPEQTVTLSGNNIGHPIRCINILDYSQVTFNGGVFVFNGQDPYLLNADNAELTLASGHELYFATPGSFGGEWYNRSRWEIDKRDPGFRESDDYQDYNCLCFYNPEDRQQPIAIFRDGEQTFYSLQSAFDYAVTWMQFHPNEGNQTVRLIAPIEGLTAPIEIDGGLLKRPSDYLLCLELANNMIVARPETFTPGTDDANVPRMFKIRNVRFGVNTQQGGTIAWEYGETITAPEMFHLEGSDA